MRPRVLTLPALFLSLLLVGCGGDDGAAGPPGSHAPVDAETASAVDPADGGEASSAGGRQGRVTTDEGVYAFEASTCLVDDVEGEINEAGAGDLATGRVLGQDLPSVGRELTVVERFDLDGIGVGELVEQRDRRAVAVHARGPEGDVGIYASGAGGTQLRFTLTDAPG
jgi:hypothetical protein